MRRLKQLLSLDLSYLRCVSDAVLDKLHGLQLKQLHLAEGYAGPASFTEHGLIRSVTGRGGTQSRGGHSVCHWGPFDHPLWMVPLLNLNLTKYNCVMLLV